MRLIARTLACAAILAAGGVQATQCGKSDRASRYEAECLRSGWDNKCRERAGYGCYSLVNVCPDRGKIVARIQFGNDTAQLVTLTNRGPYKGTFKTSSTGGGITNVNCCKDLSEVCSRSQ